MFSLFKKREKAPSLPPEERAAACLQGKDYVGLTRAYYDMGKAAMEAGEQEKAMLWLSRAGTIYSARDDIYEVLGEKLADDCGRRISELERAPLLSNQTAGQIEEKAADMGDIQVRVWSLLTLARLVPVGEALSALPGCGVLGTLGRCVDLVMKSFQKPIAQKEFNFLNTVCGDLYALSDAEEFFGGGGAACSAGAPLEVFDLDAMATLLGIESLLDGQLRCLSGEPVREDGGLIPCALMIGYWTRTRGGSLQEIPQVKAELNRIWSDYGFICSGPTWTAVAQRLEDCKTLDIFAL